MGLFNFGGKREGSPQSSRQKRDADALAANPHVQLQLNYWKPGEAEKVELERQGIDKLPWAALFRLHHLYCMELLATPEFKKQIDSDELVDEEPTDSSEGPDSPVVLTGKRLSLPESPYRPRHAAIWQRKSAGPETSDNRPPDLTGTLSNASLTHLGSIEILKLNPQMQPIAIGFVGLDEIRGIMFAGPSLFRGAKLFYDDGRPDEIVIIPLLYGPSWNSGKVSDRDGTMTRFCNQQVGRGIGTGIGIGHQDWTVTKDRENKGMSLLGIGSVNELMVGLEMSDPKFDAKCRARGLNPDDIRRQANSPPT